MALSRAEKYQIYFYVMLSILLCDADTKTKPQNNLSFTAKIFKVQ